MKITSDSRHALKMEFKNQICDILTEKYKTYIDTGPGSSSENPRVYQAKPIVVYSFQPMTDDPFGKCSQQSHTSNNNQSDCLNGANLAYAMSLIPDSEFTQDSVVRAHAISNLYIATTLFHDVMNYILHGEGDLAYITQQSEFHHEMFIKEMLIEFNQVKDTDEFLEMYRFDKDMKDVLDDVKSNFYSGWRNARDFQWIASLGDFTEEYKANEYAKLRMNCIQVNEV